MRSINPDKFLLAHIIRELFWEKSIVCERYEKMSIPQFIHQIWLQGIDNIPVKYEQLRYSWVENNPRYYYRLWDEKQLLEILNTNYSAFVPTYSKLQHRIQKVHFFQYLILYHYGGVVAQVDILNNQSLDPYLEGKRLVFASKFDKKCLSMDLSCQNKLKRAPYLSTAFIASSERNPFWLEVLREIMVQCYFPKELELFEPFIHRTTGSTLLTRLYQERNPPHSTILSRKHLDPSKGLCIARMMTTMDLRTSRKRYQDSLMTDQHFHTWSKNKRIFPIFICALFVVVAAVIVKVTILKKGKPRTRRDKVISTVEAVTE